MTAPALDLETCQACCKPMRPRGTYIDDYPGTVARSGPGECLSCAARRRQTGRTKSRDRNATDCVDCDRPMRPKRTDPQPDLVPHGYGGRCQNCVGKLRRQRRDPLTGDKLDPLTVAPVSKPLALAAVRTARRYVPQRELPQVLVILGIHQEAS